MASYYVGEKIHVDLKDEPEGIPIVNDEGREEYVLPEDMKWYLGPDEDEARWKPEDLEGTGGQ